MAWLSLLVAIALIWWLMKLGRGALFEIRLAPGKVQVKRGKVSPAFIEQARQILRHETVRGRILGQRDGDGVKLVFSRSIPEPVAQRFRNIFPMAITGWGGAALRLQTAQGVSRHHYINGPPLEARFVMVGASYWCRARWALTVSGLMATPSLPQEARRVLTSSAIC